MNSKWRLNFAVQLAEEAAVLVILNDLQKCEVKLGANMRRWTRFETNLATSFSQCLISSSENAMSN
jgi:hypothetical protein